MESDRIDNALRRIAAAVERIEALDPSGARREIETSYRALREEADATLRQLDALIEGLEA